jgi:tetratricopeptide (TPR) repeat protein
MESGERCVRNEVTGVIHGHVIQAGMVGQVTINEAATRRLIPSQLPLPPRAFTSRDHELSQLRQWLDQTEPGPMVAVISGAAGVGKTTLALRWLHNVRDRFPDGQLYVDLGAFTELIEPEQVLEWFLLALGLSPTDVPIGLAQRQALYRSMTVDRTMAVLLDNAFSAAQVRPLLPACANGAVVITSRWRLAGLSLDGARFIEVDPLSVNDSVRLLHNIVGSGRLLEESRQAEELAMLCGGMPIALSVVGGRLSAYPHRSVSSELGHLRSDERLATLTLDESSVEAIFDMSYTGLPNRQAQTYRICALHPGAVFGVDVAAAAVGDTADDVEESLGALVDRNLIKEIGDRRFRYHDLLLVHARQHARREEPEPERHAAVQRMVEWYLDTSVAADLVLRPTRRRLGPRFATASRTGFPSHEEALGWLMRERHNILHAVRSADSHGWDHLTWEFCEALWGFFLHVRHYDDWLELHRLGIPAAGRTGEPVAEARLRAQLVLALTNLHRYDEAVQQSHVALRLAEQENDRPTIATVLAELASAVQGTGDLQGALTHLFHTREIQLELGFTRAAAVCLRRIGEVLSELDRHSEAINSLRSAADELASLDRAQYARTLTCIGTAYLRAHRSAEALPPLVDALEIARELGSPHYQAEVLTILGDVAWQHGDVEQARANWTEANGIYSVSGDPKAERTAQRLARKALPPNKNS